MREQTDLPIPVRLDTRRFLCEADLRAGGDVALVYIWDPLSRAPVPAPGSPGNGRSVKLDESDVEPPIEGRFAVTLLEGSETMVVPVGSLVREHLEPWTFEHTAEVTGLAVEQIEQFAEGFAMVRRPTAISSWGSNRFFHSDQMNRAKILCLSLKGAIGRKGAGYHSTGWVGVEGFEALMAGVECTGGVFDAVNVLRLGDPGVLFDLAVDRVRGRISGQLFIWQLGGHMAGRNGCITNAASMNRGYQGIGADLDREQDGLYPRPLSDYDREAREIN